MIVNLSLAYWSNLMIKILLSCPLMTVPTRPLIPRMFPQNIQQSDEAIAIVMPPSTALIKSCYLMLNKLSQKFGVQTMKLVSQSGIFIKNYISLSIAQIYITFFCYCHQINKLKFKFNEMQKNNLNVIVFDDDQNVQNQPVMDKYASRSVKTINSHNKSDLILKEINQLQDKIKKLELQGHNIKISIDKIDPNTSNLTTISPNFKELDHLLMVVQKKIQIIVQQSRKMIQKLIESFDKKLQQRTKNDPRLKLKQRSQQIQKLYMERVQQNQRQYKQELDKVRSHNMKMQQKMIQKLSFIQQKFMNKINDFQTKEKQYVDWIHHLEAKLKQNKNKKMIQITQQRPLTTKIQSKAVIPIQIESNGPSSNLQNRPNAFNHFTNVSGQNNNSRVQRKHKIFGNNNSTNNRSSVSPVPKDNDKQRLKTPSNYSKVNSIKADNSRKNLNNANAKPENDKTWNLSNNQDANLQTAKTNFGFSKELRSANQSQFYRDVPKPGHGWDKFADIDLNDDDLQSESEDDFFYPAQSRNTIHRQDAYQTYGNSTKVLNQIPIQSRHNQQPKLQTYKPILNNWALSNEKNSQNMGEKIFSPFDLN